MLFATCVLLLQLAPTLPRRQAESARELVARARAARYQQDSALASYQAVVKQRMSGGIGVAPGLRGGLPAVGRVRLAARYESVARVGWNHELGAWAEIIAARSVVPFIGDHDVSPEMDEVALTLPYVPGRDRLWPMTELNAALHEGFHRDGPWIEHPLESGADSLYVLSLGDSIAFHLPDQSTVQLREIRVRPRRPDQRLMVGSLWVDKASGALVRAAYRPSTPVDLWPFFSNEMDQEDRDVMRKFGPYTGNIQEIVVEHGLYEGRFWLPRTRYAVGEGTARGGRVTLEIAQTFRYERVAATRPGEYVHVTQAAAPRDSTRERERRDTWRGIERRSARCRSRGDSSARFSGDSLERDEGLSIMYSEGVRIRVLMPCDPQDMLTSKELPPSIFDSADELFTETDFTALQRDAQAALSMGRQAEWQPQKPQLMWGFRNGLARYNRIEGLSLGVMASRAMGKGYTESGVFRIGSADMQPNAEARLERSNGRLTMDATAYRRLVSANDWGNPLGIGGSLTALFFGRDEGFYYRALGVETKGMRQSVGGRVALGWRVFAEREDSAAVETQFSAAHAMNGVRFRPNLAAQPGFWTGAAMTTTFASGLDPSRTRVGGRVGADGATGDSTFGRALLELSLHQGLGAQRQLTLTGSAGSSVGSLPVQRLWYIGGPETVHGHAPGDMAGPSYWLGRLEVSSTRLFLGLAAFADVGWAGPRADWMRAPSTIRGAGFGVHVLDGMIRMDVSRGLERSGGWRGDLFVDVR